MTKKTPANIAKPTLIDSAEIFLEEKNWVNACSFLNISEIKTENTLEEATKAFRKLALRYHPDKFKETAEVNTAQADKIFEAANEAITRIRSDFNTSHFIASDISFTISFCKEPALITKIKDSLIERIFLAMAEEVKFYTLYKSFEGEWSESEITAMQQRAIHEAYLALSLVVCEVNNGTSNGLIPKEKIPSAFTETMIHFLVRSSRVNGKGYIDDIVKICQHSNTGLTKLAGNLLSFMSSSQPALPAATNSHQQFSAITLHNSNNQISIYQQPLGRIQMAELTASAKKLVNTFTYMINEINSIIFTIQRESVQDYRILIQETERNAPLLLMNSNHG